MPFYEYQASSDRHCEYCAAGFELLRKTEDRDLEGCPRCGSPVKRVLSAPNLSTGPSLSADNIEKHGFTQYKKAGKGVYEKTAGKGPDIINKDQVEKG